MRSNKNEYFEKTIGCDCSKYDRGTFSGSTAQPTKLSSKASVLVFPKFYISLNPLSTKRVVNLEFEGEVQTTIEKIT